jgi:hypothetical protein
MTETYPLLTPSMVIKDSIKQYGGTHLQFRASDVFVKGVRRNDIFQAHGFSEYGFEDGLITFDGFADFGGGTVIVAFWRATIDD